MKKRLWLYVFFVSSAFITNACLSERHVKTHPDPDVRIERMQQTLEELRSKEKPSDQKKNEKGGIDDEADQTNNSN